MPHILSHMISNQCNASLVKDSQKLCSKCLCDDAKAFMSRLYIQLEAHFPILLLTRYKHVPSLYSTRKITELLATSNAILRAS